MMEQVGDKETRNILMQRVTATIIGCINYGILEPSCKPGMSLVQRAWGRRKEVPVG